MNTDDLREQFLKEHPNSKMDKCIMHEDVGYDYFTDDYVLWLEEKLMLYNVSQQRELLKAFDDWCLNNEGELSSSQDVYIDKFFNSL